MLAHAPGLATHDLAANGHLQRVLTLCALGVSFTGISHAGSMGEHQISHWIDMFAGADHPGTTHGQQVGVASLLMARLQAELLARAEPPTVRPTVVDEAAMRGRYGPALAELCLAELRKTALDADGAAALNRRLAEVWPDLRTEIGAQAIPVAEMAQALRAAGGPTLRRGSRPAAQGLARRGPLCARDPRPLVVPQFGGRCRPARAVSRGTLLMRADLRRSMGALPGTPRAAGKGRGARWPR